MQACREAHRLLSDCDGAAGKSHAFCRRNEQGFTLIELLVVVLLIGLLSAGLLLSVGVTGRDNELEREGERLLALMRYAREQAELQTREFGLFVTDDGYQFLAFDARRGLWRDVFEDEALRPRTLPEGLALRLKVEAREVLLQPPPSEEDEENLRVPHVMLFSNGDLTQFEITLEREGAVRSLTVASNQQGLIEAQPMKELGT